jgi:hypothetical protein
MTTETPNTFTEENLAKALTKAVNEGNSEEVDRLMAVELQEPDPVEPEPEPEVEETPVEETPETPIEGEESTETEQEVPDSTKDEAAPVPSAASTPEPAKVEELPENIKQELHKLRSDVGRVPYMQRRLQELERELRETKLSRTVPQATPDSETGNEPTPAQIPDKLKKRIEALREIDPDLADTLSEMAQTLKNESIQTTTGAVQELTRAEQERQDQEFLQTQYSALVAEVPYAPEIFKSKQWQEWKEGLSPGRRQLAESMYADEVKLAIGAFVHDMQARQGGNIQQATPAATPQEPVVETPESTKIQDERNRKLNNSADPKAVAGKKTSAPLDAEALFAQFSAEIRKENHL